jgi:hypothetical protein
MKLCTLCSLKRIPIYMHVIALLILLASSVYMRHTVQWSWAFLLLQRVQFSIYYVPLVRCGGLYMYNVHLCYYCCVHYYYC